MVLFKLGDKQSDFQEAVLSVVAKDTIHPKSIGVLASLPHTYKCNIDWDQTLAPTNHETDALLRLCPSRAKTFDDPHETLNPKLH